ncbi:Type IV fimbrial biogenesis protein PilY1 [hydrothermal vent metagenome]|uniref:Type IV fimbrial biogenesis protein PilY1 n=1 Tax=hydrothermal vent metagenome TaxID=652676 RepID=A0A3B0Y3G3_9ZZZZ
MRQQIVKFSHKVVQSIALSMVVFFSGATHAVGPVNLGLANTPLFLGSSVQPNVFFVSDDSGSMDWEFMTPAHWRWVNYDPDPKRDGSFYDSGTSSRNTKGTLYSAEFSGSDGTDGGYGYIYGNSDNVYGNDCDNNYYYGWTENCADGSNHPLDVDWRGRANGLNRIYYNASIEYEPWDGPCDTSGTPCDDATFSAARSDPFSTQDGYSITRNLSTDGDANNGAFIYEVWLDDSGYIDLIPERGINFNETGYASTALSNSIADDVSNGEVDLWDSHMQLVVSSTSVDVHLFAYNPIPSGGSRGLNETIIGDSFISGSGCYNVLGNPAAVKAIRDQIVVDQAGAATYIGATGGASCRTISEATQNIANWYQYYRRRAFSVKNAIAEVIDAQPTFRFGMTVLNKYSGTGSIFREMPDPALTNLTAHNELIKEKYFAFDQPAKGTPLRSALDRAGRYFNDKLSQGTPIVYSCQKNFTILFTDGIWNSDSSFSVGDTDNDGKSNTVSDVAYKYYKLDLSPLPDNVKPDLPLESDLPLAALDPAEPDNKTTIQHMVTFTVAFGVTGSLVDTDGDGNPDVNAAGNDWTVPGVPDKTGNWGSPVSNGEDNVDDLWHAAYNSAGIFASASTPAEVSQRLISAISAIASRISSAAAVALNSGTLNANSRLYQARFNSNGWSGDIFSVPIQDGPVDVLPVGAPDGVDDSPPECAGVTSIGALCKDEWSAAEELANLGFAGRNIYTMNTDTNAVVTFEVLADLGATQQDELRLNPDTLIPDAGTVGQDRLNYIRGDHSKEADQSGGSFRIRNDVVDFAGTTSLGKKTSLGDVINSAPAFVGAPAFFYPNSIETENYSKYKFDNKDRTGMVYVGTNDGMLHGFNGVTGIEQFAYIPGPIISKLNQLTSVKYNSGHNFYVDGSPIIFDAYDSGWKTMLASSVGGGGQVVFGMDISDPDTLDTSAPTVWEFTDVARTAGAKVFGDVDLGYTIGDVSFAKMNSDEWVVIFGNGYNNTEADGNASSTGNGVIYVVDAFTGELLKKFDTGVGWAQDPTGADRPNGVASVTPVDIDGDFKVDYLYAGDLFGNLWKVDVTSASASSWTIAYTGKPVFIAKNASGDVQPITSGVAVKRHPVEREQTLVLFGTGKYIELIDSASTGVSTAIETFYGIWDNNTGTQAVRSNLLEQEIKAQVNVIGIDTVVREFRITSSETQDTKYAIDWTTDKGWYIDLRFGTEYGERVVVQPIIRNNRIIFVTQTPDSDPCSSGGSSWIMELNANDGNRLIVPPFDVNGDGIIDENDIATYLSADTITSGVRSKEGIVASPGILNNNNDGAAEFKYFSGTKGGVDVVAESADDEYRKRQGWRQLR